MANQDIWSILSFAGMALAMFAATSADATPPPPTDAQYEKTLAAMNDLAPFLGDWEGDEILPTPEGSYHLHCSRNLGLFADVVLFTLTGDSPGEINVISYDAGNNNYRIFLRGYRNIFHAAARDVVTLKHPDSATLEWDVPAPELTAQGARISIRTKVTLVGGEWHEEIQEIYSDGSINSLESFVLKRLGAAKIDFSNP